MVLSSHCLRIDLFVFLKKKKELFENNDGKLHFTGNHFSSVWPGTWKPGLWMSCLSKLGVILHNSKQQLGLSMKLPPVFENCTFFLKEEDERQARDFYAQVFEKSDSGNSQKIELLGKSIAHNPFISEPHVILAQMFLNEHAWESANSHANAALDKLFVLGTNWDKRIPVEGWLAWIRVLLKCSEEQKWVSSSFQLLGLGLVK